MPDASDQAPVPDPAAERRGIVRDGIAVGVATGAYGISFGAVSVAAGLDVWQTCVLSLLVFTGASQFAFVGVLASGGGALSGAATALVLGTRNTLYGLRLAPLLDWRGGRRMAAAQLVIDESTAMSVMRETREAARVGFLATGLSVFGFWNLATLGGALAGQALGDPRAYGLDAAVGAAFLALLWPRLHSRRNLGVAALAVVVALLLVPGTTAGVPVLAAGGVALVVGLLPPREARP
jgi:predicted branched-subunit amino acid permease